MEKANEKGDFTMKIMYHAEGARRKELAQAISKITGAEKRYLGVPSCAYAIDYCTVDREGNLNFIDRADSAEVENLIEKLDGMGFHAEPTKETVPEEQPAVTEPAPLIAEAPQADATEPSEEAQPTAVDGITVSLPKDGFTETAIENLRKLVDSKAGLIKKAFNRENIPIEIKEAQIDFPWMNGTEDAETVHAHTAFIAALGKTAKAQKRVTAKEKPVDNEKYAFRCFLLRLGFIGKEFAKDRKILLANLSGSSAFKSGKKKEVDANVASE